MILSLPTAVVGLVRVPCVLLGKPFNPLQTDCGFLTYHEYNSTSHWGQTKLSESLSSYHSTTEAPFT